MDAGLEPTRMECKSQSRTTPRLLGGIRRNLSSLLKARWKSP